MSLPASPLLKYRRLKPGSLRRAAATAWAALRLWWRAALLEALCVGILWWLGLALLHVPWVPLWALLAALFAFVPHLGGALSLIGPVLSIAFSGHDLDRLALVLGLYAIIVVLDQLLIEPFLLKKTTQVPIWASLVLPILLGMVIPFWGVLLAAPLLAVFYAFRRSKPAADSAAKPPSSGPPGRL